MMPITKNDDDYGGRRSWRWRCW